MTTTLDRYYRNPAVMVPWCQRVGLDAADVCVDGFEILHVGGHHVAAYRTSDDAGALAYREPRHLTVSVLPFPCALHPDVEAIGTGDGLARAMSGDERGFVGREIMWGKDGPTKIKATCSEGHTMTAPNKGLGRAKIAAWESRHQH